MAGLGGKNWAFEEEVSSSDVNGFLADQVVMRFADEATRTAGFGGSGEPVLAEGMMSYLDDQNRVDVYTGAAWTAVSKVLQVVSTTKTDTFSTASTSMVDVTGVTVTITPSSTSSLVLVMLNTGSACSVNNFQLFNVLRGATVLAPSPTNSFINFQGTLSVDLQMSSFSHLDSPNTTSATTYKLQIAAVSGTVFVNRRSSAADVTCSTGLTVMEIGA
jgi:hypothetical protein